MSGLEAIGIAASIIQIADLGAQLSIKLCTVCRRVKNADQSIQSLSSDVALTCNVLRHLGLVLEQDTRAKLCSQHALTTAHDVLEECKKAFGQIQDAVDDTDPATAKGIFQRTVRKVGFVLREPHLAILQSNLDRLKSTMLLMVNVIIYAGQLRSGSATSALREQRELIQTLIEERKGNDLRFQNLNNPVRSLPVSGEPSLAQIAASPYMGFHYMPGKPMPESDDIPSDELGKYYRLIKTILSAIDTCKPEIERARYVRIRTGVLNIHSSEIAQLEVTHGREVAEFFSRRADELVTDSRIPIPIAKLESQDPCAKPSVPFVVPQAFIPSPNRDTWWSSSTTGDKPVSVSRVGTQPFFLSEEELDSLRKSPEFQQRRQKVLQLLNEGDGALPPGTPHSPPTHTDPGTPISSPDGQRPLAEIDLLVIDWTTLERHDLKEIPGLYSI